LKLFELWFLHLLKIPFLGKVRGDSKMATRGRKQKSVLPKVKSWRDAGDTPYRKNHQEEAKPQLLHTPSLRIASPLYGKWRNQEGSHNARHQLLSCLGEADHQVS
jgi:hypothetical protein